MKLRTDMSVRRVAADYPPARELFERYGEETGRVAFGHLEPLERFAQRHNIGIRKLMNELSEATGLEIDWIAVRDERLHGPFVLVALILTLTIGTGWGVYLLFRIGFTGAFDGVPPAYIIAHGEAQLWGFLTIFIIGVSTRYLLMVTGRSAPGKWLRGCMLAALAAGALGGFAWSLVPADLGYLAPASGLALVIGVAFYLAVVVHYTRGKWKETWARLVLGAASWLALWAGWTLYQRIDAGVSGPAVYSEMERQIVLDLALFGLAMGSVYGFGRKLLPGFFNTSKPRVHLFDLTLYLHNGGLAILVIGRWVGIGLLIVAGLLLIGSGAVLYAAGLRSFSGLRTQPGPVRPEQANPFFRRYFQLAFAWLLISLAGFVAIAIAEDLGGITVPHALPGAARHAMTVGFILTLIFGAGQRLFPILGHTLLAWPRLVVPIFLLIGLGNLLRVICEVASPWWAPAFFIMPLSSVLEFTALTLFTANALRTIWPPPDRLIRSGRVTAESRLAVLLTEYPWIEDLLISWGMAYVGRVRQMPMELTISSVAATDGIDADQTVARINAEIQKHKDAAAHT